MARDLIGNVPEIVRETIYFFFAMVAFLGCG